MTRQELYSCLSAQRDYFNRGATLPLRRRKRALSLLRGALIERREELYQALQKDFGKCSFDTLSTELLLIDHEIALALRQLDRWAAPRRADAGLLCWPGWASVRPEPLGQVLILSPWNYPLLTALSPLVGALAAGNCAVLRPSSRTAHTCEALCRLLGETLPPELVLPLSGGHDLGDWLLEQPFDLIFFTGGAETGRKVMRAAAEHLTPVVLELGGKSPCIVDATADLKAAARRIVWAKFLNAGQTCIAPDYLLVERSVAEALLREMTCCVKKFYYVKNTLSESFPQMIDQRALERLSGLIAGEQALCGGLSSQEGRRIAPTILYPVSPDAPCMREELFGPVLPVIPVDSLTEALAVIAQHPKPLTLYHFSRDRAAVARVLRETSAGGGCVNDAVLQASSVKLPFGGVGHSGMGRYHGPASFDTFSNLRSLLVRPPRFELWLRYPPHSPIKRSMVEQLLGR